MINLLFLFPSMNIFIFLKKMIGPSSTEANDTSYTCILFKLTS